MNRREVIAVGLGVGAALVTTDALAETPKAPTPDPRLAVLETLAACGAKGQLCAAHCQSQLAAGAKEFAHCDAAVNDMLAVVWATQSLIARQSSNAKKLAEVCAATCRECSAACLEHKAHWAHNMHLECKACMEACDACAKACAAFIAA